MNGEFAIISSPSPFALSRIEGLFKEFFGNVDSQMISENIHHDSR
jgi:hypothetical protein